jgi:NTE family protein
LDNKPEEFLSSNQLKSCKVCGGLDQAQIARVANASSLQRLAGGETLVAQSEPKLAIYTVLRGRLKMVHCDENGNERDIGYVNQGQTVGQSSFLLKELADEIKITADIATDVAVIDGEQARTLVLEIVNFRKNLIAAFSERAAKIFRGSKTRRIQKIVGVVSASSSRHRFLSLLCRELNRASESITVFTNRPEQLEDKVTIVPLSNGSDKQPVDLRAQIRDQLAVSKRILIDIAVPTDNDPNTEAAIVKLASECDEILWCCENEGPNQQHETMLSNLVDKYAEWKSRIVCVQILARGTTVGRRHPCCTKLVQRDLLLAINEATNGQARLFRQGMDRIVRHLRGITLGLALGGGAARGMSHLGVLRSFDREGISFDLMSGTSVGAMVGLGYAAGLPPDYLIEAFSRELKPARWLDWLPGGRRLFLVEKFRARAWEEMLRRHYHDWTFEQLPIPFSVVVTDLVSGEQVVRNTGDIVNAILESINVPLLAKPISRDGKILVDGGVLNNLPAELLRDLGAEYVVGVDASKDIPNNFAGNFSDTPTRQMKKPGGFETTRRVLDVSRRGISRLQMRFADHMIEPDTSAFDFADFTDAAAIAETGEFATEKMLPEVRSTIYELGNSLM